MENVCPACGNVWETKPKSNRQNRTFWGLVNHHFGEAIYRAWGERLTPKQIEKMILDLFFLKITYIKGRRVEEYISRSNRAHTTESWERIKQSIYDWTWENLNYRMPQPNEPPINQRRE